MAVLCIPLFYASHFSVEALSPSSANLCGIYPKNVSVTALNIKNTENQTLENVTVTLLAAPNNALSIPNSVIQLGTLAPNASSANPSWLVQCTDKPGTYTLYLGFSNPSGDLGNSLGQATSTITVYANDITPPVVQSHSPSGVIPAPYVTLEVITNEEASCKYSGIPNVAYANQLSSFQITGGTTHKASLENLADDLYQFYVRCKDLAGNEAQADYKITVEINAPPTAALKLSKPSPLREGTTEVTVTVSEPVKPVPSLSYACNGNTVSVPLTGSSASWKGYIIIDQANVNEVCSFSFSAADLTGNPGTFISSGNVFLIDTQPPAAPTLVTATERKGSSVKVSWRYEADDAVQFNVYRLSEDDTGLSLYETTAQTTYIDGNVVGSKTYYYSISAVDKAGNEGSLSTEVSVTVSGVLDRSSTQNLVIQNNDSGNEQLKPVLSLQEIDNALKNVNSLLEELNSLRPALKEKNEEFPLLTILDRIKDGKSSLLKKKEELGELKSSDFSEVHTREKFETILSEMDQIKKNMITSVSSRNQESVALLLKDETISSVFASFAEKSGISAEEKEKYASAVSEFQGKVTVRTTVQELEISYLNGKTETLLLVNKEVTVDDPSLSEATIVEYIPKQIASSVDEMILEKQARVLDKDPLLQYAADGNPHSYMYIITKELDPDNIKDTVTLVILPLYARNKDTNALTGSSVFSLVDKVSFYDLAIAVGILLIAGILVYSSVYVEKGKKVPLETDLSDHKKRSVRDFVDQFAVKIAQLKSKTSREISTENQSREEVLYPHYAVKEYKTAGLTSLKDATIAVILEKVDTAVNKFDYDRAVKIYHLLSTHKDFAAFKKESAAKSLGRVETKIALLAKQDQLQACIGKDDYLNLRYLLNEVADLYNEIIPNASEEERNFLAFIKESHDRYSRILLGEKK